MDAVLSPAELVTEAHERTRAELARIGAIRHRLEAEQAPDPQRAVQLRRVLASLADHCRLLERFAASCRRYLERMGAQPGRCPTRRVNGRLCGAELAPGWAVCQMHGGASALPGGDF